MVHRAHVGLAHRENRLHRLVPTWRESARPLRRTGRDHHQDRAGAEGAQRPRPPDRYDPAARPA